MLHHRCKLFLRTANNVNSSIMRHSYHIKGLGKIMYLLLLAITTTDDIHEGAIEVCLHKPICSIHYYFLSQVFIYALLMDSFNKST